MSLPNALAQLWNEYADAHVAEVRRFTQLGGHVQALLSGGKPVTYAAVIGNPLRAKGVLVVLPGHGSHAASEALHWQAVAAELDWSVVGLQVYMGGPDRDPSSYLGLSDTWDMIGKAVAVASGGRRVPVVIAGFSMTSTWIPGLIGHDGAKTVDGWVMQSGGIELDGEVPTFPATRELDDDDLVGQVIVVTSGLRDPNRGKSDPGTMASTRDWLEKRGARVTWIQGQWGHGGMLVDATARAKLVELFR